MAQSNPQGDFVQFILGGALASGGAYALIGGCSGIQTPSFRSLLKNPVRDRVASVKS